MVLGAKMGKEEGVGRAGGGDGGGVAVWQGPSPLGWEMGVWRAQVLIGVSCEPSCALGEASLWQQIGLQAGQSASYTLPEFSHMSALLGSPKGEMHWRLRVP